MAEAEAALIAAGDATGPTARYCSELPGQLVEALPVVRINRVGGGDDDQFSVYDEPLVDFDCFAATREEARALAHAVRDWVRSDLPGTFAAAGAFVIRTRTLSGPSWVPYENTNVRRFVYSAEVRIHST